MHPQEAEQYPHTTTPSTTTLTYQQFVNPQPSTIVHAPPSQLRQALAEALLNEMAAANATEDRNLRSFNMASPHC
jgi:hypothetical protein